MNFLFRLILSSSIVSGAGIIIFFVLSFYSLGPINFWLGTGIWLLSIVLLIALSYLVWKKPIKTEEQLFF